MALPTRVCNLSEARRRFGDRIDRLAPFFHRCDPLADAVVEDFARDPRGWRSLDRALSLGIGAVPDAPASLRALFDPIDRVPVWVDWARIERAGRLFFRSGVPGAIVLGARSLVAGYCSPAGNKPLVLTGALQGDQISRRLSETGRFVVATCAPGGLRRGGEGLAITLRVRLMHARVRWLIHRSGRWRPDDWGAPINQHDMVATTLLFSGVFVDGLRAFGFRISRAEAEDYLHLWRYSGWLMGVEPELLPTDEPEATALAELIRLTQGAPDGDSRALTRALLDSPDVRRNPGASPLAEGYLRALLGDAWADGLGLSRTPWRHAVRLARLVVVPVDQAVTRSSRLQDLAARRGQRYWAEALARSAHDGVTAYRPTPDLAR